MNPTTLLELERGLNEKLVVNLSQFKDREFIDLRLHYRDDAGGWHPARKGITLRSRSEVDAVVKQLHTLRSALPEETA